MRGTIWTEQGNFVRPINVDIGLTDGTQTEVKGHDLTEGLRVVTGEGMQGGEGSPSTGASPFMPQLGRARGQGQAAPSGGR